MNALSKTPADVCDCGIVVEFRQHADVIDHQHPGILIWLDLPRSEALNLGHLLIQLLQV